MLRLGDGSRRLSGSEFQVEQNTDDHNCPFDTAERSSCADWQTAGVDDWRRRPFVCNILSFHQSIHKTTLRNVKLSDDNRIPKLTTHPLIPHLFVFFVLSVEIVIPPLGVKILYILICRKTFWQFRTDLLSYYLTVGDENYQQLQILRKKLDVKFCIGEVLLK